MLGRYLRESPKEVYGKFDLVPNRKTDNNNNGAFSTDNIGMNYDYPDASYERRAEILREHEIYQKGLMYYLANDPGVPEAIRKNVSRWGLPKDEFVDNDHWPHQIYVREARRMISDFVMTERHLRAIEPTPESIGMGSYNMDSHNTQRYVDAAGHARNEGDFQVGPGGAYPISYRAIVPRSSECTNLLVPVCLASSHVAYGSIRMEPVFIILGQSAGTAAAIALEEKTDVQGVEYSKLQKRLLADKQVLDLPRKAARGLAAKSLPGVVIDDDQAEFTGDWSHGTATAPYVGAGYRHDGNTDKRKKAALFRTKLEPGRYEVRVAYSAHANRATAVPIVIHHAGGTAKVTLDQQHPASADPFAPLGTFAFEGNGSVEIRNDGTNGFVIVDAVQFVPAPAGK